MANKTIGVTKETHERFERFRSDLRFKKKIIKTQSELIDMLINFYKINSNKIDKNTLKLN